MQYCHCITELCSISDSIAAAAIGKTRFKGVTYSTRVKDITGLLEPGAKGVNHGNHHFDRLYSPRYHLIP